jgi:hypothetical protein
MAGIDSSVSFYRKAERLISAKKSNAARSATSYDRKQW